MFDDPNKELRRLQDRLLAAEEEEDPEAALAAVKSILKRDDWNETSREPLYRNYVNSPDPEPAPAAVPVRSKATRKNRIVGILVFLTVDCIALALALTWWLLWK